MSKSIKLNDGDIFQIKLNNESYAVGQIIVGGKDVVLIALADKNIKSYNESITINTGNVIAISFVTTNHFDRGLWEIVDNKSVIINANTLEHKDCSEIGAISYTSAMFNKFTNAYFCLHPWNCYFDPNQFDEMLLEHVKRPENIILNDKNT